MDSFSLSHTHTNSLDLLSRASSSTIVPRQLPQLELNPGSSPHSAFVNFVPFSVFSPRANVKGLSCGHHFSICDCSMKQKIQFSSQLWGLMFLCPYDVLLLTCCWKAGAFRPGGSLTWQKAYVFALSRSVGTFYKVWCGTIALSVSPYCVCCIRVAGHTVFHVALIRLSLAGPAASMELRRAAQQGRHSPPTKPHTPSPQPSRRPPRVALLPLRWSRIESSRNAPVFEESLVKDLGSRSYD